MSQGAEAAAKVETVLDDQSPELARTYAEALLNAASQTGENTDEVLEELETIRDEVFGKHPALAAMLSSPLRTAAEKDKFIADTFEGRTSPTVSRFLRVLNRHDRSELLGPITRAARAAWDRRQNRKAVTVHSAVPLDEGQLDTLRERLSRSLRGTPVLKPVVDPSLIGGLVIQVGDDVYDASVKNRLEQVRKRLSEGKTHEIQSRRDHFCTLG